MADYSVTLACRNYDRTQAVIRGTAKAEGVDLRVVESTSVPKMFGGLVNGEYDVAEFSMAELVYSVSREQNQLVAIPVFPLRMFRHAFAWPGAAGTLTKRKKYSAKTHGPTAWKETAT